MDERRTNLTRFPLFFPEKREFFLDGVELLRVPRRRRKPVLQPAHRPQRRRAAADRLRRQAGRPGRPAGHRLPAGQHERRGVRSRRRAGAAQGRRLHGGAGEAPLRQPVERRRDLHAPRAARFARRCAPHDGRGCHHRHARLHPRVHPRLRRLVRAHLQTPIHQRRPRDAARGAQLFVRLARERVEGSVSRRGLVQGSAAGVRSRGRLHAAAELPQLESRS